MTFKAERGDSIDKQLFLVRLVRFMAVHAHANKHWAMLASSDKLLDVMAFCAQHGHIWIQEIGRRRCVRIMAGHAHTGLNGRMNDILG
jgi:hypothetical protein